MTNQCQHGQLARVCLTCEHEATIAALTAENARLTDQLHLAEVVRASQVEGLVAGAAGWRERANQLEAERDRLREELERALVDAERYRWLRDKARSVDWTRDINGWSWEQHCRIGGQGMDTAIDAAMRKP